MSKLLVMGEEFAAQGHTGAVTFDGSTVVITHNWRGKLSAGRAPKVIPAAQIQQVDYFPASAKSNGHVRFAVPGEMHDDQMLDKRSLWFTKEQSTDFDALISEVRKVISGRRHDGHAAPQQQTHLSASEALANDPRFNVVVYGAHQVAGGHYRANSTMAPKPIVGAAATFESGADRGRPTLTRIGAGAIIAGPAGAVVGGLFKKNTSKCYVTIEFPDGEAVIVEGPAKDETKLRQFAADLNKIARA